MKPKTAILILIILVTVSATFLIYFYSRGVFNRKDVQPVAVEETEVVPVPDVSPEVLIERKNEMVKVLEEKEAAYTDEYIETLKERKRAMVEALKAKEVAEANELK